MADVTNYIVANPGAKAYMSPEQVATQRDIADYGTKVNFWQWSPEPRQVPGDLERGEGGEVAETVNGVGCEVHGTWRGPSPPAISHCTSRHLHPPPAVSPTHRSISAHLTKRFGDFVAVDDLSLDDRGRRIPHASSAPRARARPPRCA